jgi:hypothetical protein
MTAGARRYVTTDQFRRTGSFDLLRKHLSRSFRLFCLGYWFRHLF